MRRDHQRLDDLVVVDANLNDYEQLLSDIRRYELRVRLFSAGEVALQATGADRGTLWLVNFRLPDMSGLSLLALMRHRAMRCPILIASDVYSAEDELDARAAGATAYVCKPATVAWLQPFRPCFRSNAIRAGPEVPKMRVR